MSKVLLVRHYLAIMTSGYAPEGYTVKHAVELFFAFHPDVEKIQYYGSTLNIQANNLVKNSG
jgi:hypothetical protein